MESACVFERKSVLAGVGVGGEGRQGAGLAGVGGEGRRDVALPGVHGAGRQGDGLEASVGTRIGESRGWTLVQAAAFPATHSEFREAMRSQLGADLPTRVGDVARVNGRLLLKTGAEQYWIIARAEDGVVLPTIPPHLAIPPAMGAITDLSHSRACMFVEGADAGAVLAKGVPLDFHPDCFRIDEFALTGLHHMPVLIHRCAGQRYELYALRTYALSVWEWLADAV
jgi:methylglutamate dehydrogenase subunit D